MKWKQPQINTTKINSGFLLLPKTIKEETRWMCFAKWSSTLHGDGGGAMGSYWTDDSWID
jgi:hypothetical protein